jgi:hypothetical protein
MKSSFARNRNPLRAAALAAALLLRFGGAGSLPAASLREALTFHASFDGGLHADFAAGERVLYHAVGSSKSEQVLPGLPAQVVVATNEGRFRHALRFTKKRSPTVFFQGARNVDYRTNDWSGTVSFWLRLDPETDLEPGYTDPIQITPRAWNDAAFFVEFSKDEKPRHFRLGVYADLAVWNPQNRKWEDIPFAEKPLVSVTRPPFGRDRWTHVAFTFERFNTGREDGAARLYLNGQPQGALSPRRQTFTWEIEKTRVMLGLSYIGWFDELSLFNRALNADEVKELYELTDGVRGLLK